MFSKLMIAVIFLVGANLFAQPPDTQWTKIFGGPGNDYGASVKQTSDGGYIIVGSKEPFLGVTFDVWLIKTDANGNTLWAKTFVEGAACDFGYSGQQTQDGGYIIAGWTETYGAGEIDVWLIKTDANGDTLWTKTFGGIREEWARSVQQTQDGGYIIAGHTNSYGAGWFDVWLIKTDPRGNPLWTKTFGGTNWDESSSVQQTRDGGYIIVGHTYSYGAGETDVWLIKTDANGDTLWTKTFGGTSYDYGSSVQQTQDGGYIIVGYTHSYGAGGDVWLIKTDPRGNSLWTKTFGGTRQDWGVSVQQTQDGGYIIAGKTESYGAGQSDVWLIKTNADGDTLWTKIIGGPYTDCGSSVQQTQDGGYIIVGETTSYGAGEADIWLIKLGPVGVEERDCFSRQSRDCNDKLEVYPNPAFGSAVIGYRVEAKGEVNLSVYDISGRLVRTIYSGVKDEGKYKVKLSPGIYFIRLENRYFITTKKLTILSGL